MSGAMRVIAKPSGKPFEFQIDGEETVYTMPHPSNLFADDIRRLGLLAEAEEKGEDVGMDMVALELELIERYIGERARTLTLDQLGAIYTQWIKSGESQASPES